MSFGSISRKSSDPFETVKLTWHCKRASLSISRPGVTKDQVALLHVATNQAWTVPSHCPYAAEAIIIPPFPQFTGTNDM
jgi:hypothetical protein